MKKTKALRRRRIDSLKGDMNKKANGVSQKKRAALMQGPEQSNGWNERHKEAANRTDQELELERAIQRYADLYEFAPSGFVSLDRSGRILETNLTASQLLGLPRANLIGRPFAMFVTREDTPIFLHHLLRCRASDTKVETDLRLKNLKGESTYVQLCSMPILGSAFNGGAIYQSSIVDLTERKLAEEGLREKEAELELIVTHTPFMLTRCTSDLRYRYVSRAYAHMLGRTPQQVAGRPILEVMGKKGFESIRPYVERVLKGETVSYEAVVPFKGAGPHSLSVTYVPDKNDRGEIVGWVASMADVSERKKAEERFRLAVQASPSGMVMVDEQGKMTLINSQAERLFGYGQQELLGKPIDMLFPERFRYKHPVRGTQSAGEPMARTTGAGPNRYLVGLRKNGTEVPIEIGTNPIKIGSQTFVLSSIVDVTERKRTEQHLRIRDAVSRALAESNSTKDAAPRIVQAICEMAGWDAGAVWDINRPGGRLFCVDFWHRPSVKMPAFEAATRWTTLAVGTGLPGRVWKSSQPIWVPDITQGNNFTRTRMAKKNGLRGAVCFPIKLDNEVVAVVECFTQKIREIDQEMVEMLALIGVQVGQFVKRKKAEDALVEATRQQMALYEFSRRCQTVKSFDDIYTAALSAITKALECNRASILLYDQHKVMRFVAWRGLSAGYRKAAEGHSPWKPDTKNPQPTYVSDVLASDLPKPLKQAIRRENIRSAAFIPLVSDGKLIGKFMAYHRKTHVFTRHELELATAIGRHLAQVIEHERNEAALRESEARMRATVEQATAGVGRCETNGRIVFGNRTLCRMLGYEESELIGKSFAELTHPEDSEENIHLFQRMMRQGKPFEMEKRYVRKDGSVLWGHVSVSPVRDATGKIKSAVAVAVDVTARKEAEKALQKSNELLEQRVRERTRELHVANKKLQSEIERRKGLEGEILSVSDREQQRLGQELHDGLCQHLTAVAFMTRSIALRLRDHRVVDAADIEKVAELVNKAAIDTRNLSRALHRVDVDAAGLVVALQDLADREIWRTPCRLEAKPSFGIDNDAAASHLYRIAREAVINANKHAQAREIVVRLERVRKEMVLRVIDNGIGLPKELKPQQGLGFHIMNYRAQLMGGRLEIDSPQSGGTSVSCYFPLQATQLRKLSNGAQPAIAGDLTLRHLAREGAANA
ncbi:MAG TPA: PAS domain S-box protein [Candidatus Udaeobacter sp.]